MFEFRNVSFQYPDSYKYALHNISLKISMNEKIAIVGANGSGKTTLIKLLCRLYDPTEGVILLNGIDIKEYSYEQYLALFSVLFQDFNLFSFSLGQNIATDDIFDKDRVEMCIRKVGLKKRYDELTKGLDTFLYKDFDEHGIELSGGEAQRIALARALYREAPFVILDEPTAALDPKAEYSIYRDFNNFIANKTAIYISHRLSSCIFCDQVVVMDKGELVEYGTHADLIKRESKYAQLWNAQAQFYVDG